MEKFATVSLRHFFCARSEVDLRPSLLPSAFLQQRLTNGPSSIYESATNHPIFTGLLVVASWVLMWYLLKWCMQPMGPETSNAKYD